MKLVTYRKSLWNVFFEWSDCGSALALATALAGTTGSEIAKINSLETTKQL